MVNFNLEQIVTFLKTADGFSLNFGNDYTIFFRKSGAGFVLDFQPQTSTTTTTTSTTTTLNPNLPACGRGPTLFTGDGNPAILNITSTSLSFRFDGDGLTSIKWRIKSGSTVIRNGVVVVFSNVVPITFLGIEAGNYTFEIEGQNCTSPVSSASFTIAASTTEAPVGSQGFSTTITSEFDQGVNSPFVSFFDSWGVAGKVRSAVQNAVALLGFDYLALTGRSDFTQSGNKVFVNWLQKLVSFPSSVNNVVQDGNKTYYFRPPGYTTNPSINMYDFHIRFPLFSPPTGKIIAIQAVPFSQSEQAQMIQRGVTHVRDGVPNANKIKFWMDDWLNDVKDVNGQSIFLPPAYQGLESDRANFYEMLDPYQMATQLYAQFQLNNLLDTGYIFWNYERVNTWDDRIGTWGAVQPRTEDVGKAKKRIFFEEFARLKSPSSKFVAWTQRPIKVNPDWLSQSSNLAWDAVYNGTVTTLSQLDQIYATNNLSPRTFVNGDSSVAAMDIYHVGFYQIGVMDNIDFMYKHVHEAFLNKKLSAPGKKTIGTLWIDNETLEGENDVTLTTITLNKYGETQQVPIKPVASISYMQTFATWMTAIADGFDVWEDRQFEESQNAWNRLKDPALRFQPPQYPTTTMKGIEWVMSSVWSLRQNDDILTANTQWTFPQSPYAIAKATTKTPLVAWKLNATGTRALVLVVDVYNDDLGLKSVGVNINGTVHQIVYHHKITSIVRITL